MTDKQRRKFLLGLASLPFVPAFVEKIAKAALTEPETPKLSEMTSPFYGGNFQADSCFVVMEDGEGLLAQHVGINYTQSIRRGWDKNGNVVYCGGDMAGEIYFGRLIGPTRIFRKFLERHGDITKPSTLSFHLKQHDDPEQAEYCYKAKGAVISRSDLIVTVEDMTIMDPCQMVFTRLEYWSKEQAVFYNPVLGEPHDD